jgi:hypothetical protein
VRGSIDLGLLFFSFFAEAKKKIEEVTGKENGFSN